ncbi:MAG: response regulator [Anaerolineales bacterium]|nr:response regulator [Anaerolineales bacterium]
METKRNILVIDDELGIREGCRRALTPQGFSVETASTLKEGREKIKEFDFDLVLLDVMMPDGRGIELLGEIQEKDPNTVCVIITGYATVELAVETIKQGAYDFISKPFTAELLLLTVNQGLERRRLSLEAKRLQSVEEKAAELERNKEEMERTDQFKSQFMLTVAHELRSPVGGAQSLLRTLIKGLAGDISDQQKEILVRIDNRLSNLVELVDDLLSLAETKTVEVEKPNYPIDILPILTQVIDQYTVEADSKDVDLKFESTQEGCTVWANESGLYKVFNNLINNAIKYTSSGGRVVAKLNKESEGVRATISDSGVGIPAKDMAHIGEEFHRAGNVKKMGIQGTGLGLSIVYQHMNHFNGIVEVISEEGKGTTFTLFFPKIS